MTESETRVGNPEQATVYTASKLRTALLALGAALSVFLGYVLVLTTEASAAFVGALSILFFGACLVLMVAQLFRRSPALVITDRGSPTAAWARSTGPMSTAWPSPGSPDNHSSTSRSETRPPTSSAPHSGPECWAE
ncbi:hypothetical protein KHQ06_29710 [Nocardia tengchongensis]|uniref:Uncharacterized protein n=1 Tax=Nocardia tengchongensis TaxID=2055889 RepID=A0ABX8CK85_9NOCA|nr:STM3941 family protein [Nocardia tengchongensis]QVI20330.1 hypothetical protein KHQ06_29710 [Nocardia tengchongensis]